MSFDEIKGSLNLIGHHLLKSDAPLLPQHQASTAQAYLERLNLALQQHRRQLLTKGKLLYSALAHGALNGAERQALLTRLKSTLNTQLLELDAREQIQGKPLLDRVPLGPTLRPGQYALSMEYQDNLIELAGAFVLTEQASPAVTELTATTVVGRVLLFTPSRGIETFDSLVALNNRLRSRLDHPRERNHVLNLLPTRYQGLPAAAIWPLSLVPIDAAPLFEHTYTSLIAKRSADVDHALSRVDNPANDPSLLVSALDRALSDALPDLTARLAWRAQLLLDRWLRHSAPDWYRSANETRRAMLAENLRRYNEARQHVLNLLGPITSPHALARYQWLERLSDDLEINDLDPDQIEVNTRRVFNPLGEYEHDRSLVELALRGPHRGDELANSDFLEKTTLTCNGARLSAQHSQLTPAWLLDQLATLQPRIDFGEAQKQLHAKPQVSQAIAQMLDQRINALAYTSLLQGHITEHDFNLIQNLRQGTGTRISASTLYMHEAQLQDLWVLRQRDADGVVTRVLLCTPEAPSDQQFHAFTSDAACQSHILGWTLDNGIKSPPGTLTDYLVRRVALRFRQKMKQVLSGLSFKPQALEHEEVTFGRSCSHADCLKDMAAHVLATRVDDYEFSTPGWFRAAPASVRRTLTKLAEDADGGLSIYNSFAHSQANVPRFDDYLHEQASKRLNTLLGNPRTPVDPDTVWAYSPPALIGSSTPTPISYTQLYRDGYADGVGFLDEKFSRSARFKGPEGTDLRLLTAENVARSVTGVWIGQRYVDEIKSRLLNPDSPGYQLRRIPPRPCHSPPDDRRRLGNRRLPVQPWRQSHIALHPQRTGRHLLAGGQVVQLPAEKCPGHDPVPHLTRCHPIEGQGPGLSGTGQGAVARTLGQDQRQPGSVRRGQPPSRTARHAQGPVQPEAAANHRRRAGDHDQPRPDDQRHCVDDRGMGHGNRHRAVPGAEPERRPVAGVQGWHARAARLPSGRQRLGAGAFHRLPAQQRRRALHRPAAGFGLTQAPGSSAQTPGTHARHSLDQPTGTHAARSRRHATGLV
ncbi:hypothetical protein AO262_00600 [Pseudomonas fluorescens ABAC62]|nr:hypothetical protein AO262_00600 [Pseudomonas fluorescens ABAC62]